MKYQVREDRHEAFVLEIQNHFNQQKETLFQERNTIKCLEFENERYAVKSFKIPHLLNQVVYRFFRASKAERSYTNSVRLGALGIHTPKPIGYIEFPVGLLFKESYYISAFYDFDFEIRDVLANPEFEEREAILRAFAAFSYDLHEKGVFHVDYSPGNVIIKKLEQGYEFAIIDVNRMKFISYDDEMRFKNLSRFSTTDADLEFIARAYAKVAGLDEVYAVKTLWKYHHEHQDYLRNKKRLKALKKKK